MNQHTQGLLLAIIGIIILSPDSLLIRLIESEPYPLIALRALSLAVFVGAYIFTQRRAHTHNRWMPLFWYGVWFGAGLLTFPLSIFSTYTANTLTIIAATPIFAAIGAHFFLGEKTAPMVWFTALAVFVGIAIIFAGGIDVRLVGNAYALATALVLAISAIIIRRHKTLAIFPGIAFGGLWVFVFAAALTTAADWQSMGGQDIALAVADGMIVGLSFLFITKAAQSLPPAEIGLIFLLEAVLGPLWTWLFVDEVPPIKTLLASALILAMLAWYGAWSYRQRS